MSDYEDSFGNTRNVDGTFTTYSGLGDQATQIGAGVGIYDSPETAYMKVEAERLRQKQRVGIGGYVSTEYVSTGHSRSSPSLLKPVVAILGVVLLIAALPALREIGNPSTAVKAWALEETFRDEAYAPFSAYAGFVPKNANIKGEPTKALIESLVATRGQSMSSPRRRILGASAWKCYSEKGHACIKAAASAAPAGATITFNAALDFLAYARTKGSQDAAADLGLLRLNNAAPAAPLRALGLAQSAWKAGLHEAPPSPRAKLLLDKSETAWRMRFAAALP